ncbi:MAG: NB-ARC domain-containing protein [Spirulinaceae cyanobacterium]
MDILEALSFTDKLVCAKTGKHLDDLQQAILRGTIAHQKYAKIAEENHCTLGHVRDVAYQLWKILSDELGEDIRKNNFCATVERLQLSARNDVTHIDNMSNCREKNKVSNHSTGSTSEIIDIELTLPNKIYHDLDQAPDINSFYGRTQELSILNQWILRDHSRLVTVFGMSGMGKTSLVVELVKQIQAEFEYIIWRSLCFSPLAKSLETQVIQFFYGEAEIHENAGLNERRSQIISFLRSHRCLMILDDVHHLFCQGELAGKYNYKYEDYSTLIQLITECSHQSCVILISDEKPTDVSRLEAISPNCQSLRLTGMSIAAKGILEKQDLLDKESWDNLIKMYGGNPTYLICISTIIKSIFGGSVADFLQYNIFYISDEIETILDKQWQRLTSIEKEILLKLSQEQNPTTISQFLNQSLSSSFYKLKGLQSLIRRSLVDKYIKEKQTYFSIVTVLRNYVKKYQ